VKADGNRPNDGIFFAFLDREDILAGQLFSATAFKRSTIDGKCSL
jgi:hypothetical protein